MSDKDKPRVTLSERATALAAKHAGPEKITGAHLETAIIELETKANTPPPSTIGITETQLRQEMDLLYHELTGQSEGQIKGLETQLKSVAASLDTIRLMLNIFGEELLGADTSDLFKEAEHLMQQVLEPLARKAPDQAQEHGHPAKQDDPRVGEQPAQRDAEDVAKDLEDPDLEMNGHELVPQEIQTDQRKTASTERER